MMRLRFRSLLGCALVAASAGAAQASPTPPVVHVAADGSGDFNASGSSAQIAINQALDYVATHPGFTTVHLAGPAIYTIDDTIRIGNDTILEGDRGAVIRLGDNVGWPVDRSLLGPSAASTANITVRNLELDGNTAGNPGVSSGAGFHNFMTFRGCSNLSVHDLYMHDNNGDGLKTIGSTNVAFYANRFERLGHDGIYFYASTGADIHDNVATTRVNSAFRVSESDHVRIHDNHVLGGTGGAGVEIQKTGSNPMNHIEIDHNRLENTHGAAILVAGYGSYDKSGAQNLSIHHNIVRNAGTWGGVTWVGGVVLAGFDHTVIENNVFDGAHAQAIAHLSPLGTAPGTGYTTLVRNNIIVDTVAGGSSPAGTGWGVRNLLPSTHQFVVEYNCLYHQAAGDYFQASATHDIHADPLFADGAAGDYHLKSQYGRWTGAQWVLDAVSSPCIDAGDPASPYANEPEPNGNRIDVGAYGNTAEASRSADGGGSDSGSASVPAPGAAPHDDAGAPADAGCSAAPIDARDAPAIALWLLAAVLVVRRVRRR